MVADGADARREAVGILERGGVVAIPTDTVYGIAADIRLPDAIERLFAAKSRPPDKAVALLIADVDQAAVLGVFDERARRLANRFWPGGMTLVLPVRPDAALPRALGSVTTVGVRVPDHDCPRSLARSIGPMPTTSANPSGQPEARTADDIVQQLGGSIDLILDGGPAHGGPASTVIDLTADPPVIRRPGPITPEQIAAALDEAITPEP